MALTASASALALAALSAQREALNAFLAGAEAAAVPRYVLLSCAWCLDCSRAAPGIREELAAAGAELLELDVGPPAAWKSPAHPWRGDAALTARSVPMLARVGAGGRLGPRLDAALEAAATPAAARAAAAEFIARTLVPYRPGVTGASFANFWPYYLGEHSNRANRRLHFLGTTAALALLAAAAARRSGRLAGAAALAGFSAAWLGHAAFERNRPATLRHPLLSLAADLRLWAETVAGRRPL
jgi:hypothetical protein